MKLSIGFVAVVLCCISAANAQPADNGRVLQDETGRYADAEATIKQARTDNGIPFKVYVGSHTPNNTNVFSHNLARQWNIPADGLLFCIFDDRRQVAITAGTDLEGKGIDGAFIAQTVIPSYFKTGWQEGGLAGAVRSSVVAVRERLNQPMPVNGVGSVQPPPTGQPDGSVLVAVTIILFAVFGIVIALFVAFMIRAARRMNPYAHRGTGTFGPGMDDPGIYVAPVAIMMDGMPMQSDPGPSFDSSPSMDVGGGFDSGGGFSDTGSGDF